MSLLFMGWNICIRSRRPLNPSNFLVKLGSGSGCEKLGYIRWCDGGGGKENEMERVLFYTKDKNIFGRCSIRESSTVIRVLFL